MNKTKFVLNRSGVGVLLKGEEMKAMLEDITGSMVSRCGNGYEADVHNAGTRIIGSVAAETFEARRNNLKNNTILKSL